MMRPENSNWPGLPGDQCCLALAGSLILRIMGLVGTAGIALMLVACAASVRPGPVVDPTSPAPFATADGPTPTQAQAQVAVDAAVRRDGLAAVLPQFSTLAAERAPALVTLFACGSVSGDAISRNNSAIGVSATCHVDVLDHDGGLVGRTTMRFLHRQGAWMLATNREREIDAR